MYSSEGVSLSPESQVGEGEVVSLIECSSLKEVDSALKSTLRLSKHSNSLPGPLTGLKVAASKTCRAGFVVELRMKKIRDREASSGHQGPILKQGLEAYRLGRQIFTNKQKTNPMTVVEAMTDLPERQVVVKLYQCGLYGLNDVLQEALMQMKIENIYVCRLLDISLRAGEVGRFEVGLVMERLEGDLEADILLRTSKAQLYEEAELLHILRDIADALVFAKLQGVAHRDIKPGNIFKDEHCYKLGDFGSACAVNQKDFPADGTLDYLSPEMRHSILGDSTDVDFYQSDVFSLGITMLHLAKLALPTRVSAAWNQAETLEKAIQEELQGLSYSDSFKALLTQMLSMNSIARPHVEEVQIQSMFFLKSPHSDLISTNRFDYSEFKDEQRPEVLLYLAKRALQENNLQEAERTLLSVLKIKRQLSREMQWILNSILVFFYLSCSRRSEGKAVLQEMLQERPFHSDSSYLRIGLANIYLSEGRVSEAESLLQMVSEAQPKTSGDFRISLGLLSSQWRFEVLQGNMCEAEATLRNAFLFAKKNYGEKSWEAASIQTDLGFLCTARDKYMEGEELLLGSIELLSELFEENHRIIHQSYDYLALNLLFQNRLEDAEILLRVTLDLFQSRERKESSRCTHTKLLLSEVYREQGRLQKAEKWLKAAFKCSHFDGGEKSPELLIFSLKQVVDHIERQQWPEVERLCNLIVEHQTNSNLQSAIFGFCYYILANLYIDQSKVKESGDCCSKSRENVAKIVPEGHYVLQNIDLLQARCYILQGRLDEAKLLTVKLTELNCADPEQELNGMDMLSLMTDAMNGNIVDLNAKIQKLCAKSKRTLGGLHDFTKMLENLKTLSLSLMKSVRS